MHNRYNTLPLDSKESFVSDTNWRPDLTGAPGPLYRALAEAITEAVARGDIRPGERLPPVRDLAWSISVSPGAVSRAYRIATERGALEATVGRGTFARAPDAPATPFELFTAPSAPAAIDFRGNQAVEVGQDAEISSALSRMAARADLPLTHYPRQREESAILDAYADWLRGGGVPADPAALLLTTGAQEGVATILSALARGGAGVTLCEPLAHPGLREAAEAVGMKVEPVAADAEGVTPASIDAAARRLRPDALLLSATFSNPSLTSLSESRRSAIVEIARARDFQIVEDDVYGWLLDRRPPSFAELAPERGWYVSSLSKCVAAGLRVGFFTAPRGLIARAHRAHNALVHHTPWLTMALGAELIRNGDAAAIRARVAAETADRAAMARAALGAHGLLSDDAASFALLPLDPPWTAGEFCAAAAARGVLAAPRSAYAIQRSHPGRDFIRIALGARGARERFARGLAILAELCEGGQAPAT